MARRIKTLRVIITPNIERAAALRGLPLTLWVQTMLHTTAWRDFVEARTILENAGFADRAYRERKERDWREHAKQQGQAGASRTPRVGDAVMLMDLDTIVTPPEDDPPPAA